MRDYASGFDPYTATLLALQRRRALAQAQIEQGMETTPIRHWSQGANRALQLILGTRDANRVDAEMQAAAREREAGREAEMARVRDLLAGTETVHQPSGWAAGDAIDAGGEAPAPTVIRQGPDRAALAREMLGMKNPEFQHLGMQFALAKPPEEEAFTLKPGETRFRGGRQVASLPPEPPKPERAAPDPEAVRLSRIANDPTRPEFERRTAQALLAKMTRQDGPASDVRPPVVMQTPDGPVFVYPPKDPAGAPAVVPAGVKPPPKEMPASVVEKMAQNNVTLSKIDRAMEVVDKYPGAFGLWNKLGDTVRQRTDPEGVEGRAMIADIAGQKIHDRSGAAVTVGEAERLKPYVPNVTDAPEVVKRKLSLFRQEYAAMQDELAQGRNIVEATRRRSESGGSGGWGPPGAGGGLPRVTTKAERDALPPGTRYIAPDGSERVR